MSWDLVIIKLRGPQPARVEEIAAEDAVPLGTVAEVRAAISVSMPEVNWCNADGGILDNGVFSIEFHFAGADAVESLHLHVRGQGDPAKAIMGFVEPNGWSAIDCSMTEFLEAKEPSREGWDGYRALLDRATGEWDGRSVGEGESPGWKF